MDVFSKPYSFKNHIYLRIFVILLCCVFVFHLTTVKAHAASFVAAAAVSVLISVLVGMGFNYFQDSIESSTFFNEYVGYLESLITDAGFIDEDGNIPLLHHGGSLYLAEDILGICLQTVPTVVNFLPSSQHFSSYTYENYLGETRTVQGTDFSLLSTVFFDESKSTYTCGLYAYSPYRDVTHDGHPLTGRLCSNTYVFHLSSYDYDSPPFLYGGIVPTSFGLVSSYSDFTDMLYNYFFVHEGDTLESGDVYTDLPIDISLVPNLSDVDNPDSVSSFYPAWKNVTTEGFYGYSVVLPEADFFPTQAQVQAGVATDVPGIGEGTGTIAGWLENIWTGVQSLPQSIATSVTDALSSKIEPEQLELNLTEFFPFCIPFDIYEFFAILAADPVPPVFELSIPVPQLGASYDFEIDLSPWDSVAQLFRTLELLAFCVGLAFFTRDKFTRG